MSDTCPAIATTYSTDEEGEQIEIDLTCDTELINHIAVVNHHDPEYGDWGDYLRTVPLPEEMP